MEVISFLNTLYNHLIPYQIEIHDLSGNLLAVFKDIIEPEFDEALNMAKLLSFSVPADDDKLSYITAANEIWVRDIRTNDIMVKTRLARREDIRK